MALSKHPFEYQPPTPPQVELITAHRELCRTLYDWMVESLPQCADRTLAIRALETCSMWANKAIVFEGESYLPPPVNRGH